MSSYVIVTVYGGIIDSVEVVDSASVADARAEEIVDDMDVGTDDLKIFHTDGTLYADMSGYLFGNEEN